MQTLSCRRRIRRWTLPTIILALAMSASLQAEDAYFYRKGKKVPLTVDSSRSYVLLDARLDRAAMNANAKQADFELRQFAEVIPPKSLNLVAQAVPKKKWAIIDNVTNASLATMA